MTSHARARRDNLQSLSPWGRLGPLHELDVEAAIQTKLFVGNLDFATTPEQLRELFGELGEIVSVTIPSDRLTGRARGFAFVEFANGADAASAAQKLDGSELGGRAIRVNEATERPAGGAGAPRSPFGHEGFAPRPPRAKGSRRNMRARKRGFR